LKGSNLSVFVKHTNCKSCGSKDNFALYVDDEDNESGHCFGCGFTIPSKEYIESKQDSNRVRTTVKKEYTEMEVKSTKPVMTPEENQELKNSTSAKCKGFRSLRDDIVSTFGVRHSFDEVTGDVNEQYYPCTQDGQLVGYKVREVPKNFYSKGRTGADCELFGQFKFNRGGKYVLLVEGEVDQLSAYQMIHDYNKSRGSDFETAVVSPTTGANSKKQIAAQYKFFDSFEQIICCMDSDKAGQEATEEIIKYLPKGKVKLMQMRFKDPNEYLEQDKQREFISDFYNAKTYVPAGVVGSSTLYERLLESAVVEKIPLPPFMSKLDDMIGSIELGTIGVFAAGSGAAKTTVANELIYYWLFNSPHKIGVVSLELTCAQYAQAMLSRHIENKISLIKDPQEKLKFLQQDRIKDKAHELFLDGNGGDRFLVIDERDGSVEVLQNKIEELIISCGCKVIILDPLSDVFDSLTIDEQAKFMKWCKSMIKNYNVTFLMIAHIRKSGNNKDAASTGAFVPEEAISGSSTVFKSASWVVMMQRDKYNEDPIIRNTTRLVLSKNRAAGETGEAGNLYYCNQTHKLHDLDDWNQENGVKEF
jgi:archaellum biogenesis ATPase FlaH/Zn ribbon nucleic-acid-binding protein